MSFSFSGKGAVKTAPFNFAIVALNSMSPVPTVL